MVGVLAPLLGPHSTYRAGDGTGGVSWSLLAGDEALDPHISDLGISTTGASTAGNASIGIVTSDSEAEGRAW